MAIAHVKNKVISDAEQKALGIKNESGKKVREIQSSTQTERKNLEQTFENELKNKLSDNERRYKSLLERDVKMKREKAKREIVEEVLAEALSKMTKISDDEMKKFALTVISELPKNLKGEILVSPDKSALYNDLSAQTSISIKEDSAVKGGFMVSGDDFLYDFTFKNLLEGKKADIELQLSKIIFI